MNASLYIHVFFVFKARADTLTEGAKQWKFLVTSIVTFKIEVANLENDIASEKRPQNQCHFAGKEFHTH